MQKKYFRLANIPRFILKTALSLLLLSFCIVPLGTEITHANGEAKALAQFSEAPQRIVVFPLFAEEMLLEMIGPDRIVYVGHEYWENGEVHSPTMALTKHIPGRYWNMCDVEEILELKPDLVILDKSFLCDYDMIFPELVQANIAFFFLDTPETIEDIMNALIVLGEAVGAPEKAAQMVRDMDAALVEIAETVAGIPEEQRVRAAYWGREDGSSDGGVCCELPNNFSLIAHAAGVINASGSDADYEAISIKRLVEWNPDLLAIVPVSYNSDGSIWEISGDFVEWFTNSFLDNPELSNVTAIKNRNVHPLRLSESQFIVQSVKDLAQLAYPDLFPEN